MKSLVINNKGTGFKCSSWNRKKFINTMVFIMPTFLLHAAIVTIPAFSMLYYSLTEWSGIGDPVFIGLENFRRILFDKTLHFAIINNIKWLLIFITVPLILGLLVALLVIKAKRAQMLYRTVIFLPYVLSAVVSGKIWVSLYNNYFGINRVFENLGLTELSKISWIGDPKLALYSVAFVDNWHWWGFVMVLFISALHQIDVCLYEAASIEGASPVQKFWYVTIPQIRPTLMTIMMITMIGAFLTFDYVYIMTQGGPGQATEIVSTWIYKSAFFKFEAGYANAISLIVSMICGLIYLIFNSFKKRGWDV